MSSAGMACPFDGRGVGLGDFAGRPAGTRERPQASRREFDRDEKARYNKSGSIVLIKTEGQLAPGLGKGGANCVQSGRDRS
jgi:hypothetical protein